MLKVCARCAKSLPKEQRFCGDCGAQAMDVLEPGEREAAEGEGEARRETERDASEQKSGEQETPKNHRGRDVGARMGHLLFKNSPLEEFGVAAGYVLGRALEGAKLVSFSELPPEPKRVELVDAIFGTGKKRRRKKGKGRKKRSTDTTSRS